MVARRDRQPRRGQGAASSKPRARAFRGEVRYHCGAPQRDRRRDGDGSHADPLSRLARAGALLLPRRGRRRPARRRHLRLSRRTHARLCERPRYRVPAHQHHPRRRRRRTQEQDLPAHGGHAAFQRDGRRDPAATGFAPVQGADGIPGRARTAAIQERDTGVTACGPARAAPRPHHGGDLPRAARRDRERRLSRAYPAYILDAAAQILDRLENVGRAVAVVGAGYAGMAAAVTLAERGIPVTVFEAGPVPGGRARRVISQGHELDNGQHILVGAYSELWRILRTVGVPQDAFLRLPLEIRYAKDFSFRALWFPAPFGLLGGLLAAKGVSLGERLGAVRFLTALRRDRKSTRLNSSHRCISYAV